MSRTIFYFEVKINFHHTDDGVHLMTVYLNNVPFDFALPMNRSC